jgi:large subunit ribosomal protein L31
VSPALVLEGKEDMKKDIHPRYEEATITCACGNITHTRSTVKKMYVNTCSQCHPFFTGQSAFIDSEGRVEQFRKRYSAK